MKSILSRLFGNSKKANRPSLTQRRQARLQIEGLEDRQLMSASPIAAPIAKPIMAPALAHQAVTNPLSAQIQVQHQAIAKQSQSVAYSPLTGEAARCYLAGKTDWTLLHHMSAGNVSAYYILQNLQLWEKRMELLGQYERYYEGLGYNGWYFRACEKLFYGYYHLAVQYAAALLNAD